MVLQMVQMSLVEWAGAPSSGGSGELDIIQRRAAALNRSSRGGRPKQMGKIRQYELVNHLAESF